MTFEELIAGESPEEFLESAQPFMKLMMEYKCAMLELKTKFEVLDAELSLDFERNPIESITCRLKKPLSILKKLKRMNLGASVENIERYLHDVAGVRVICSFPKDIYVLADKICSQDDVHLVEIKDYIKNPKPNGYRSLHLILKIPVFLTDEKKFVLAEVQLRTIAMDFWASIEHKVQYKKEMDCCTEQIVNDLRLCAEGIHAMDLRMQEISRQIDQQNSAGHSQEVGV